MPRKINYAFSTPEPLQKIFVAIETHDLLNVRRVIFGKSREFRGHPAKVANHFAHGLFALLLRPFRKSQPKIKQRGFLQLGPYREKYSSPGHGRRARKRTR